jgi:hypothetical protein
MRLIPMQPEHRRALFELLARLDQNVTEADRLAPLPMYTDVADLFDEPGERLICGRRLSST